jgi:hypothetical protein
VWHGAVLVPGRSLRLFVWVCLDCRYYVSVQGKGVGDPYAAVPSQLGYPDFGCVGNYRLVSARVYAHACLCCVLPFA